VLILIGALLAGAALLFRAGQAQGYIMGATAASRAAGSDPSGAAPLVPFGPGYWPSYAHPPFSFFPFAPFGGLCGSILMVLLVLFALRLIFRPHRWFDDRQGPGDWRAHPHPWGPPPWMRGQQGTATGQDESKAATDQPTGESPA